MKILSVFGTRPEAIKMAPVIQELRRHKGKIDTKVCVTAQHRQMLDPFLKFFDIKPDYDLNLMKDHQTLGYVTATILTQLEGILTQEKPDFVLVQGDTTTSMTAALAAFYQHIRIGHIEAGLRTGNKESPFPEEINRRFIDQISDLYFVHTSQAKETLLKEGVSTEKIECTGNTVIDALLQVSAQKVDEAQLPFAHIPLQGKKVIVVTAHRRENWGKPMEQICEALKRIAQSQAHDAVIIYSVHKNPLVRQTVERILKDQKNIYLMEPLEYLDFVHLMKKSTIILTDSGGLQEEAITLHKPVLVLRTTSERPEGMQAGATRLVGVDTDYIVDQTIKLLHDSVDYKRMSSVPNPYGDGQASQRIVKRLLKEVV